MMPVLIALIAVAYAAAAWFLLFVPRIGQVLPGGAFDTGSLDARLAEEKAYLAALTGATEAARLINPQQKAKVAGIAPFDADVPGLFVEMDALAQKNGMVLVAIDTVPREGARKDGIKEVAVSVNLAGGTYRQFVRFLSDVERNLRLLDPRAITFTPGAGTYGVSLTAYFLEE
jgi:Tfp pilus assembly protein PilO